MADRAGQGERERLVEESLHHERETGQDSIPTIERMYHRTDTGGYRCCWPGCGFVRRDPVEMWRHVHGERHTREWEARRV